MSRYHNNTYINLLKPGENRYSFSGNPNKVTYQTKKQVDKIIKMNKKLGG